jgi:hypothetical protein
MESINDSDSTNLVVPEETLHTTPFIAYVVSVAAGFVPLLTPMLLSLISATFFQFISSAGLLKSVVLFAAICGAYYAIGTLIGRKWPYTTPLVWSLLIIGPVTIVAVVFAGFACLFLLFYLIPTHFGAKKGVSKEIRDA